MDIIKEINRAPNVWQIIPYLESEDLERVIKISSDSYHNSGISLISDEIYDILVDKLKQIKPNSTILKITGAPIRGKKVRLPYWMGSMNKIKSDESLVNKWINKYPGPYVISDKLDGISCLLVSSNGKISLYTRGDGKLGMDISHLTRMINMSADLFISKIGREKVAIRGELIMTIKNFQKYENIMSNARNMVGGIVNSKKESVNKKHARDVDLVMYEIIDPLLKPSNQMKRLQKWGLNVVNYDIYEEIDLETLDTILNRRKKKSRYEIDGIIVTNNHKHKRNISGNPDYSFAFKGLTQMANVKVIKVLWKPSSYGVLVPRIHFEKVRLSQADLEYTTGFNARFILDNKIGPGAILTIIRSSDVIPHIVTVVKPAKKLDLPGQYDYKWDKNKVNFVLKDPSSDKIVIIQRLTKFVRQIGAENISEGIITRMVTQGFDNIPKIITMTKEDFLTVEGFQETLANKLYNNLRMALDNLNLLTLMVASNVFGRGMGEKKIKKILDVYPDIVDKYNIRDDDKWRRRLMNLDGFDSITVDKFLEALPDFQIFYNKMKKK